MTKLSVNLNKIALLRNSRGRNFPSVEAYAQKCLSFGAHGITIHPRPDERHARYSDIHSLAALIQKHPGIELNIEGYPVERFLEEVIAASPHQCTLVPDAPDQITSDHGWDLPRSLPVLIPVIERLKGAGIRTSIFLDPVPELAQAARDTGADRIELYTEPYAAAFGTPEEEAVVKAFARTAEQAGNLGLGVNAGHDLNLQNLSAFLSRVNGVLEVSIGHALTVEAIDQGLEKTVRSYVDLLRGFKSARS